jgi:hypothetical protein
LDDQDHPLRHSVLAEFSGRVAAAVWTTATALAEEWGGIDSLSRVDSDGGFFAQSNNDSMINDSVQFG